MNMSNRNKANSVAISPDANSADRSTALAAEGDDNQLQRHTEQTMVEKLKARNVSLNHKKGVNFS
jgi:hypothetical protein